MSDPSDPLAGLVHELKTPLAAIIGYADAMRLQVFGPLDEPYVRGAETIHTAAHHLLALVDDLAGGASRRNERFDARPLMTETVRLFDLKAQEADVSLACDRGEAPLTIQADPLALRQILINLLANALAATPPGGIVRVSAARDDEDLILEVADTGPGMTATDGLGLILTRALCARQGGRLAHDPAPGGGTVAIARLPVIAGR